MPGSARPTYDAGVLGSKPSPGHSQVSIGVDSDELDAPVSEGNVGTVTPVAASSPAKPEPVKVKNNRSLFITDVMMAQNRHEFTGGVDTYNGTAERVVYC